MCTPIYHKEVERKALENRQDFSLSYDRINEFENNASFVHRVYKKKKKEEERGEMKSEHRVN